MFEDIGTWLTQIRILAALAFLAVIATLAVVTAWKTKSTPATIGVIVAGAVALAMLAQLDVISGKVSDEIDGTNKTTADTGGMEIISEFGGG